MQLLCIINYSHSFATVMHDESMIVHYLNFLFNLKDVSSVMIVPVHALIYNHTQHTQEHREKVVDYSNMRA